MKKLDIVKFAETFYRLESGKPIKLEAWQLEKIIKPIFHNIDDGGNRVINEALIMLPKKNGKTSLMALFSLYLLLADGEESPEVFLLASDKDQARICWRFIKKAVERSPELKKHVKVFKDALEVPGNGGLLQVLASDSDSAHGLNPHGVIVDELWSQRNWDLLEAMTHSPARKQALHLYISYTGFDQSKGVPLWDLYQRGLEGDDPRFFFYSQNENLASWVTEEYLDQQRRRLPENIFRRLHCNEWTSGIDSFLTRQEVDAAVDLDLEQSWKWDGLRRVNIAVDLGLRRDRTAIIGTYQDDGIVKLVHAKTFKAPQGGEVNVSEVEAYLVNLHQAFHSPTFIIDPWQAVS
ncbi:MAG: terminase large subunit, partial [bacterium]|nr:terminase large subunit [bacterium]